MYCLASKNNQLQSTPIYFKDDLDQLYFKDDLEYFTKSD